MWLLSPLFAVRCCTRMQSPSTAVALLHRPARCLATMSAQAKCPLLDFSATTLRTRHVAQRHVASVHAHRDGRALAPRARVTQLPTRRFPAWKLPRSWLVTLDFCGCDGGLSLLHAGVLLTGSSCGGEGSMLVLSLRRRFCWLPLLDAAVWLTNAQTSVPKLMA